MTENVSFKGGWKCIDAFEYDGLFRPGMIKSMLGPDLSVNVMINNLVPHYSAN